MAEIVQRIPEREGITRYYTGPAREAGVTGGVSPRAIDTIVLRRMSDAGGANAQHSYIVARSTIYTALSSCYWTAEAAITEDKGGGSGAVKLGTVSFHTA